MPSWKTIFYRLPLIFFIFAFLYYTFTNVACQKKYRSKHLCVKTKPLTDFFHTHIHQFNQKPIYKQTSEVLEDLSVKSLQLFQKTQPLIWNPIYSHVIQPGLEMFELQSKSFLNKAEEWKWAQNAALLYKESAVPQLHTAKKNFQKAWDAGLDFYEVGVAQLKSAWHQSAVLLLTEVIPRGYSLYLSSVRLGLFFNIFHVYEHNKLTIKI